MKAVLLLTAAISFIIFPQQPNDEIIIDSVLTRWHNAAAQADEDVYFGLMTDESIFLGTDATERWSKQEFIKWSEPYFNRDSAWKISAAKRFIIVRPGDFIAWFDEDLTTSMGPARGSGVLIKEGDEWKIAHYNLALTIPNDIIPQVKALVEESLSANKN